MIYEQGRTSSEITWRATASLESANEASVASNLKRGEIERNLTAQRIATRDR